MKKTSSIPNTSCPLFTDTRYAWLWLVIRCYVGYEWLIAGWEKFNNPVWVGPQAGVAVTGFLKGALGKMSGLHPDVSETYGYLIQNIALPNAVAFSYMVTFGEILVGLGLIFGLFTGIAAFFGAFMNFNFLFAGTVSTNPILLLLQLLLIAAWRTAGWFGLDYFAIPAIGTCGHPGTLFKKKKGGR